MRLWTRNQEWRCTDVHGAVPLGLDDAGTLTVAEAVTDLIAEVVPFTVNGGRGAALVTRRHAAIRLNGCAPLSVTVLDDRDEILIAGHLAYFAACSPTEARSFPAAASATDCARCKRRLDPDDIVRPCPACAALQHAGRLAKAPREVLDCAQYDPACGGCGRRYDAMLWAPGDDDE